VKRLTGLLPEKEKADFLLKGQPPLDVTKEQFQELIGAVKIQAVSELFLRRHSGRGDFICSKRRGAQKNVYYLQM